MTDNDLTRLSINLNAETADALRKIAARRGISYTEAVRRAIAVYTFIDDEVQGGAKIATVRGDDYRELVLL
jgi:hypothetical protein